MPAKGTFTLGGGRFLAGPAVVGAAMHTYRAMQRQ
jgi:hypothetical protein